MAIPLRCPHCGSSFKIKERYAGKEGSCPSCGGTLLVPSAGKPTDDSDWLKGVDEDVTPVPEVESAPVEAVATDVRRGSKARCPKCAQVFRVDPDESNLACPKCGRALAMPGRAGSQAPTSEAAGSSLWEEEFGLSPAESGGNFSRLTAMPGSVPMPAAMRYHRRGNRQLIGWIWWGSAALLVVSLVAAAGIMVVYLGRTVSDALAKRSDAQESTTSLSEDILSTEMPTIEDDAALSISRQILEGHPSVGTPADPPPAANVAPAAPPAMGAPTSTPIQSPAYAAHVRMFEELLGAAEELIQTLAGVHDYASSEFAASKLQHVNSRFSRMMPEIQALGPITKAENDELAARYNQRVQTALASAIAQLQRVGTVQGLSVSFVTALRQMIGTFGQMQALDRQDSRLRHRLARPPMANAPPAMFNNPAPPGNAWPGRPRHPFPQMPSFNPAETVTLTISGCATDEEWQRVTKKLQSLTTGTYSSTSRNGTVIHIAPVPDFDAFVKRLDFGEVNAVDATQRTITFTVTDFSRLPPAEQKRKR